MPEDMIPYNYDGSTRNDERLKQNICRCGSEERGRVFNLRRLIAKGGKIYSPMDMTLPLCTPEVKKSPSAPIPPDGGYGKTFIFAIDRNLEIHVAADCDRLEPNAVKHETLFHNADVLAAGEICIKNGVVVALNDHSNTYQTYGSLENKADFAKAVLDAFQKHSVPVDSGLKTKLKELAK